MVVQKEYYPKIALLATFVVVILALSTLATYYLGCSISDKTLHLQLSSICFTFVSVLRCNFKSINLFKLFSRSLELQCQYAFETRVFIDLHRVLTNPPYKGLLSSAKYLRCYSFPSKG